jgi:hypothetical protein
LSRPLDAYLPDYAHNEVHERTVAAMPVDVWRAIHEVTLSELAVTRPLVALRALPARLRGRRPALGLGGDGPVLERFMRGGWCVLSERAPEAFAAGAIGQPWRLSGATMVPIGAGEFASFAEPGYVRMALSFELEPRARGTRARTETRVQATDPASARAFARYWRAIRLPSGLIRRDLLRAIARRAER